MVLFGCPFTKDPDDPRAGTGGPPHGTIADEHLESARISNEMGTLSMVNKNRPNTGGSQFVINLADNDYLDWFRPGPSAQPVFGRIIRGLDVIDALSRVDRSRKPPAHTRPGPVSPDRRSAVAGRRGYSRCAHRLPVTATDTRDGGGHARTLLAISR